VVLPEWKAPEILTDFDDLDEPQLKLATKKITAASIADTFQWNGLGLLITGLSELATVERAGSRCIRGSHCQFGALFDISYLEVL
jgi:hypothetical protein